MNTEEISLEVGEFMGILKIKESDLNRKSLIIKKVLEHFDRFEKNYATDILKKISTAADNAFRDEILFEEFENWISNKDDESFIYLINHYWDTKDQSSLGLKSDITGNKQEILKIKEKSKREAGQKFASILLQLCNQRNLKTLKEIGDFLGGLSEERIRILLEGKHKPQRATILKVSKKFKLDPKIIFNQIT